MHRIQRFTASFSAPPAPPRIYLDPDAAARAQAQRAYRLHVFQIPRLRVLGLSLIALFVLLHNLFLLPTPSAWAHFWRVLVLFALYMGVSWLILWVWYSKVKAIHLGTCFLACDIVLFLVAIYYAGGEHSWLFFLLMVRTADQTRTTWRHTLLFAHASTGGYVLLLLYLGYVEQRPLSLPAALTTVCLIYASNWYLAFVAKAADNLRHRMTAVIRVARDLIRQLGEQSAALQASENDYRALVEHSIQGISIHQHRRIQLANPALAAIFSYDSPDLLIGQDYTTLIAPHERDRLESDWTARLQGKPAPARYEYQGVRRDGTCVWIECLVSRITWRGLPAILATLQDITARQQAEEALQRAQAELEARVYERTAALQQANRALRTEIAERQRAEEERQRLTAQLQQAQKLEALGTLAGGIAHDFNNILSAILGYTELTLDDVPPESQAWHQLQHVLSAGQRAKDLVHQILTFSRHGSPERCALHVGRLVLEVLGLLRASLPTTIEIRTHLAPKVGTVLADPTQMHQVLLNLCTNAEHAMRETGGLLEIGVDTVEVDEVLVTSHQALHPGPHVRLTIRDTGHGMAPDVLERMFEPFFTTKGVGVGTGLGLSVVHGIIAAHQGAISVQSTVGQGTTFTIYLPCFQQSHVESPQDEALRHQGQGRILFVDDEAPLAHLAEAMLTRLGYEVVACTSSVEALEAFRAAPQQFDVVITDQTMPHLTGEQLARALRGIRPDIPIILCTGFSHVMDADKARVLGLAGFCRKPFSTRDLAHVLSQVVSNE